MLKHDNNEEKRSKTLKLFTHVIQTYHKKPYPNVVKNILLYGIWINAAANQYKEAS